jgi:hypothetical protein
MKQLFLRNAKHLLSQWKPMRLDVASREGGTEEADTPSAGQKFPRILRNHKGHYRVHKNQATNLIVSLVNPVKEI